MGLVVVERLQGTTRGKVKGERKVKTRVIFRYTCTGWYFGGFFLSLFAARARLPQQDPCIRFLQCLVIIVGGAPRGEGFDFAFDLKSRSGLPRSGG